MKGKYLKSIGRLEKKKDQGLPPLAVSTVSLKETAWKSKGKYTVARLDSFILMSHYPRVKS